MKIEEFKAALIEAAKNKKACEQGIQDIEDTTKLKSFFENALDF